MKKATLLLIVFLVSTAARAQQPSPTPVLYSVETVAGMNQLRTAALADNYAYERLRYLSYNIGPRLSGSAQAARSVEYVAAEMRRLGLEVRLQRMMVPRWVRGEERAELVRFPGMAEGSTQKVVVTALGGSVATPPEGLTADVVVVKDYDDLARIGRSAVEGRIVLFNDRFDRRLQDSGFGLSAYGQSVQYRFGGAMAAARYGAVAALVRSAGGSQNRLAHTGSMGYDENAPKIPGAAVSFEDAEMIASLAKEGTVRLKLTLTPSSFPDVESFNVIADLKGSERPNEVVIVSGHLDSWDLGQGALDDGAGIAVSMQVPFLIKKLGLKTKRTIRFIAYMNEENGGRGGAAYLDEQKDQLAAHFAAIESDLGASHPLGFNFAGRPEALAYFAPISAVLREQGSGLSQIQPGVGADIGPLTQRGVPSFAPWFDQRTYFNYHHTAADTFDKVDPANLGKLGAVMAVLAFGLANLEQPIPR